MRATSESSEHNRAYMQSTRPEHYVPSRRMQPRDGSLSARGFKPGGTSHWRSEYSATVGEGVDGASVFSRSLRAPYVVDHPVAGLTRIEDTTFYRSEIGGMNPRSKLPAGSTRLPVLKTSLTAGTAKGTSHVPGYQGHIPAHPLNPASARAESGVATRPVEKLNYNEIYHTKLVGYGGHVPQSARNAGGRERPDLTTYGREFVTPRHVHPSD
mmetsp:Transcript_98814/g.279924  ORF Transcript_98814/g.279924 Transcript_98814/m.279924 type:complete len:212 (+) Transcript_98814:155-790(+)